MPGITDLKTWIARTVFSLSLETFLAGARLGQLETSRTQMGAGIFVATQLAASPTNIQPQKRYATSTLTLNRLQRFTETMPFAWQVGTHVP